MKTKQDSKIKGLLLLAKLLDDTTIAGFLSLAIGMNAIVSKHSIIPHFISENYFPVEVLSFLLVIFGVQLILNTYDEFLVVFLLSLPLVIYSYIVFIHNFYVLEPPSLGYTFTNLAVIGFLFNSWIKIYLIDYLKHNYTESDK